MKNVRPVRGSLYFAEYPFMIEVTRVSKAGEWADIVVRGQHGGWTKRQPLRDGCFPFEVKEA